MGDFSEWSAGEHNQPITSIWPPHDHGITQLEKLKRSMARKQKKVEKEHTYVYPSYIFEWIEAHIDKMLRELKHPKR